MSIGDTRPPPVARSLRLGASGIIMASSFCTSWRCRARCVRRDWKRKHCMAVSRQRNSDLDAALAEAREHYAAARPESARIHRRAREVLPGGNTRSVLFYTPFPTAMARGAGCFLEDVDDRRYVDFCG